MAHGSAAVYAGEVRLRCRRAPHTAGADTRPPRPACPAYIRAEREPAPANHQLRGFEMTAPTTDEERRVGVIEVPGFPDDGTILETL